MKPIRNSVKAVITRDDAVLMIRCQDQEGVFYILPGGGQESRETMAETAVRECLEEIGCPVEVGPLLYVCEYIGERTKEWQKNNHQIEFMFRCTLPEGATPVTGHNPDDIQTGVEWMPIHRLPAVRHYPAGLATALAHPDRAPAYWGNVKDGSNAFLR